MEGADSIVDAWIRLNEEYVEAELEWLRLLLQRRILWLRNRWGDDPLEGYQGMVVSDARADRAMAPRPTTEERRFYESDEEAAALGERLVEASQIVSRKKREMKAGGMTPAIDRLAEMFGLNRFEREVLLLVLAPEIDPRFEKLYAYVQDDPARKYATPHLALTLLIRSAGREDSLQISVAEARSSFRPQAPLRRYRLIRAEKQSSEAVAAGCPLRIDARVASYLLGINEMSREAAELLRSIPALPVSAGHEDLAAQVVPALRTSFEEGMRPVVTLKGPAGSEKEALAGRICTRLNMRLYRLLPEQLLSASSDGRSEKLRILEREAVMLQLAYYIDTGRADRSESNALEDLLERLDAMIFVDSQRTVEIDRKVAPVEIGRPDARGQEQLWKEALEDVNLDHRLNGSVGSLVEQFNFGPRRVRRVIEEACRRARRRAGEAWTLRPEDLWDACRQESEGDLDGLARKIDSSYSWEDIVLPDDTEAQLREIAAQVRQRRRVYESWGFRQQMSRGLGISALFSGPSGTGKTMAAEVVANDLALDVYRIDLANMVSKYIGETEKNLEKLFDAAERSGTILFFDEADALFGKRTEVSDSHDRYANIEVDYLLQRMEEYRGLAILATNRKSDMDEAFLRRLRFIVEFPRPNPDLRRRIWEQVFPDETPVGSLDYSFLAQLEITGANIHNIALNAAFLAAEEGTAIEMEHIMHAARREYGKIDKLVTSSEFGAYHDR